MGIPLRNDENHVCACPEQWELPEMPADEVGGSAYPRVGHERPEQHDCGPVGVVADAAARAVAVDDCARVGDVVFGPRRSTT